jgi:hypothetical protein
MGEGYGKNNSKNSDEKKQVDDVLDIISSIMESKNFLRIPNDNVIRWTKCDGVFLPQKCLDVAFSDEYVQIQGWIKDIIPGEYALEGFVGCFQKKEVRKCMDQIQETILSQNL